MVVKVNGASDNELYLKKNATAKQRHLKLKGISQSAMEEGAGIYFWSEIVIQLLSFAVYLLNDYTQDANIKGLLLTGPTLV